MTALLQRKQPDAAFLRRITVARFVSADGDGKFKGVAATDGMCADG